MLLTLLFHQISPPNPAVLEKKLLFLKQNFPILLPGEKIPPFKTSLLLTFDDAYFDFYHYIFPLLKKLQIKALLAVPAGFILEKASLAPQERLALLFKNEHTNKYNNVFQENLKEAFCSFAELKEMADSGLVEIASHSFSHANLTLQKNQTNKTNPLEKLAKEIDLKKEVVESKQLLEAKLGHPIQTFVYPYGRFNSSVQAYVKKHYQYALRIGSALNFSWQNFSGLIYRNNLTDFNLLEGSLKKRRYLPYMGYYLLNTVRGR